MADQTAQMEIEQRVKDGWGLYAAGKSEEAVEVLQSANAQRPDDIEILYVLGLALRKAGQLEQATKAFRRVVELGTSLQGQVRASMLRRLAQGHVNLIERGAWDLEAETWHKG